ncbi:hypothetical protein C2S52_000565 [Perilla frutescens var. hirtella]|nr:hypothetical protein C2S51_007853 [Perilla frutescens var. frutescens]KAH6800101.1 hypothetical protein C2S52_000565 [Perilla frutescens var. hirtella]
MPPDRGCCGGDTAAHACPHRDRCRENVDCKRCCHGDAQYRGLPHVDSGVADHGGGRRPQIGTASGMFREFHVVQMMHISTASQSCRSTGTGTIPARMSLRISSSSASMESLNTTSRTRFSRMVGQESWI